jgi:hypothetical protein
LRIEQRHKTAGLIVTDVLREAEAWLIDERLEESAPEGVAFAGRLSKPDGFAMTCGAVVPVDRDLIEEVTLDTLAWRRGNPEQVAQDPRFAIAIYRAAIDSGMMGGVTYERGSDRRRGASKIAVYLNKEIIPHSPDKAAILSAFATILG